MVGFVIIAERVDKTIHNFVFVNLFAKIITFDLQIVNKKMPDNKVSGKLNKDKMY